MNQFRRLRFLFIISFTISPESPPNLNAQSPKAEKAPNLVVTFTNATDRRIVINAPAPGRQTLAFGELQAGESTKMNAYPGQRWVFVNTNGEVLGEYLTQAAPRRQTYSIARTGGGGGTDGNTLKPAPIPTQPNLAGDELIGAQTGSALTAAEVRQMVNFHNQKRAEAGSGNVTWSTRIAQFAQQRADHIARTKQFSHLPRGRNPYGENLASGGSSGGGGDFNVVDACEGWYAEKAKMPRNARTMTVELFNKGVGHYTQMIWKDSTRIGAGVSQYQQGEFTMTVVVCCYYPPGNVINQAIY